MTTESKILSLNCFKEVVSNAPLFAIDLVVLNQQNEILVGQRLNSPAKGSWFVPGGRIYKNETLENAFMRISKSELGSVVKLSQAKLLGVYDHFYEDSFFSEDISTHYINATHAIHLKQQLSLPKNQHDCYRWIGIDSLLNDDKVHKFSKVFLPDLMQYLKKEIKDSD